MYGLDEGDAARFWVPCEERIDGLSYDWVYIDQRLVSSPHAYDGTGLASGSSYVSFCFSLN